MRISIITVNFNNKDGLEKTIKSVISQPPKLYEYIIIDGGSTDGSVDVIKSTLNIYIIGLAKKTKAFTMP